MLALDSKGNLYSTGASHSSLGREVTPRGKNEVRYYPADKVDLPKKVVDFSASGAAGLIALLEDGEVWVWGGNGSFGLAMPEYKNTGKPVKNPYLHQIVNIGELSAVDIHGNLYIWGEIGYGNPKAPSSTIYRKPIKIADDIDPVTLVYGNNVSGVLTKKGELITWGWDKNGQLGTGKLLQERARKKDVLTTHNSLFTTH